MQDVGAKMAIGKVAQLSPEKDWQQKNNNKELRLPQ